MGNVHTNRFSARFNVRDNEWREEVSEKVHRLSSYTVDVSTDTLVEVVQSVVLETDELEFHKKHLVNASFVIPNQSAFR